MKLLVVGGVAGGASAAARARRLSEEAEIILFERGPDVSFANCGMPYFIHSEMPQQERGRMRGFQLWINLPAKDKMKPAGYRDIQPEEIPVVPLAGGGRVKVIAGTLQLDGRSIA